MNLVVHLKSTKDIVGLLARVIWATLEYRNLAGDSALFNVVSLAGEEFVTLRDVKGLVRI